MHAEAQGIPFAPLALSLPPAPDTLTTTRRALGAPCGMCQNIRNLARAAAGRPLDVHDGVLGHSGDKWEAHSGSTRPGEFCDFDGTQGRAMRALFLDYCNELV